MNLYALISFKGNSFILKSNIRFYSHKYSLHFAALRKMRKLDQVASKIRTNMRKNAHRRSYRLPISIYKLKHLIMKPRDEEEDNENKRLGRAIALKNGEDFHNQAGKDFSFFKQEIIV